MRPFLGSSLKAGSAIALLAFFACPLSAAPKPASAQLEEKRADLDDLKQRIRGLQNEIEGAEATRSEAADALRESEKSISDSRRRLREIAEGHAEASAEVARIEAERSRVAEELESQRKALGETLYAYYVFGRKAGARRILGADDPNQVARDAYYLERIADRRHAEIEHARETLQRHEALVVEARQRNEEVAALEQESRAEHAKLLAEQKERAQVLAQIQERLRSQRKEVANLKQDEKRLSRLIDGLAKLPPPRPRPAPQPPKKPAEKPSEKPSESASSASTPVATPARPEPSAGRADSVAEATSGEQVFASLRGKLRWPLRGELVGRFGAPRGDGATQWKGVFIRAEAGDVRAVADGRVVYADWLRGFGNLIIVDHGGGYMTIYGNNEGLLKSPGAMVKAGEVVASVGSSGGSEESGLYFEIRYNGQAQDPAKWVAGR
ncbi:peptidoglycan DD-metalloendopeptidase family protein [Niveibacterium sp. SC-1]|uniref:murein hydrolase activator EnvC family protein n=1 Tax=Niveibacterium sp. SC-1 TaxID=3135646 RepID=UPI00311F4AF9